MRHPSHPALPFEGSFSVLFLRHAGRGRPLVACGQNGYASSSWRANVPVYFLLETARNLARVSPMLSAEILQAGRVTPRARPLKAGPLTMLFEPETAFLRHIRLGDHEVLRALYAAIRDENWATILPRVTMLEERIEANSFHLAFECVCQR